MKQTERDENALTERRLIARDIRRKVILLAFPGFISSMLVFGMNFINYIIMALFCDYSSIASYGIVSAYTNMAAGFFIPLSTGVGVLLDRARKAGDHYKIQSVISTAMILALILGLLSTAFALAITPGYIWQVVTPEEIKDTTTAFYRYFSLTLTPILFFSVTTMILIALGEQTGPILSEISAMALHGGFSYIFVGLFGWDIRGIAISAVIAQTTGSLINIYMVLQRRKKFLTNASKKLDLSIVKELASDQKHLIFMAVLGGVFAIFLQYYIDLQGVIYIAGFTLFFLFQDALFIPIHALRTPARRLSPEYYEEGGNELLIWLINPVLISAYIFAILLIPLSRIAGPPLFLMLSHSEEVAAVAMRLVNLVSFYYLFYASSELISASLIGLGKERITMWLNIVFNYFARFAVLVLAAQIIQGAESIVICYPVSWALSAAALAIYYFAAYSKSSKYSI